jgi:hypothetical protein
MSSLDELLFAESKELEQQGIAEITNNVSQKINELLALQKEISQKEEELKKLEEKERHLSGVVIPEIFTNVGLTGVTLPSGQKITIKNTWKISPKKDAKEELYRWFLNNEPELVNKNIYIPVEDTAIVEKVAENLKGLNLNITLKEELPHSKTLESYFTKRKEGNNAVPEELLNIFQITKTNIKG